MPITVEQLTAAYEDEKKQRHPPVSADDIPFAYEDISAGWLTTVLCAKVAGARVLSHRIDTPDDGTTSRCRIAIEYNEAGRGAGLPEHLFCKASQGLLSRLKTGIPGAIQIEVNFYNRIRPRLSIEAPECCFASYNEALNSIIMMRDLGGETVFCSDATDITRERIHDQLQLLATLHGEFLDSPEFKSSLTVFPTWPDFFSLLLSYPNIETICDQGFAGAEAVIPPRLFAQRREIWPATLDSVTRHETLPHTLCHNDLHPFNWYINTAGRMGLSDWQAVTRSHWSRDVAYTMSTCLTVENRRLWEDELLRFYHDGLQQAAGRILPYAGFTDEVRRQLMSVLMFWTFTINPDFMPGMNAMPHGFALENIRRISTAIDDLDALAAF